MPDGTYIPLLLEEVPPKGNGHCVIVRAPLENDTFYLLGVNVPRDLALKVAMAEGSEVSRHAKPSISRVIFTALYDFQDPRATGFFASIRGDRRTLPAEYLPQTPPEMKELLDKPQFRGAGEKIKIHPKLEAVVAGCKYSLEKKLEGKLVLTLGKTYIRGEIPISQDALDRFKTPLDGEFRKKGYELVVSVPPAHAQAR